MKNSWIIIICFILVIGSTQAVFAADVQKVAVICIDRQGSVEASDMIKLQIRKYFKTPLESIVRIYDLIPDSEITLPNIAKRKIDEAFVRDTADRLKADILVVVELRSYQTWIVVDLRGEEYQRSNVGIHLHIFQRGINKYTNQKLSRDYHGEASLTSTPEYLLKDILYEIEEHLQKEIPFKPKV